MMVNHSMSVQVPDSLYARLKERAAQAHHTVEDEVLSVLAAAVPREDALPPDVAEAVEALEFLDDASLWRAASSRLSSHAGKRLESLNEKGQREGLTDEEQQDRARLVRQYERAMLVRAQAALLLKQRGHDVASLLSRK